MSTLKDILVIIISSSGSQKDVEPVVKTVLDKSKLSYVCKKVKDPSQAQELIQKNTSLFKTIAVYGGDGSIVSAIKTLADTKVKLLILPGGTGNLIATDLGLVGDIKKILQMYIKGDHRTQLYDIASLNKDSKLAFDIYNGWWAQTTLATPPKLKKKFGALAYGLTMLKSLPQATRYQYKFEINGRHIRTKGYTVIIANRAIQNFLGMRLFARPHRSGVLQVAVIKSISPIKFVIWFLGRGILGIDIGGLIKTYRGREVIIHEASDDTLKDDRDVNMSLPTRIIGGQFETRVIVPAITKNHTSFSYKSYLLTKLQFIAMKERLRNLLSGRPSSKYSQVAPHLYLGGTYKKSAADRFNQWGVTGVVNMRSSKNITRLEGVEVLQLKTPDWRAPTLDSLEEGTSFINQQISQGGGVYVHCRQGEGRGPTMAAAYLVSQGLSVDEALTHIKQCRPMAHPNKSQTDRLIEWQKYLKKQSL